MFEKIVCLYVCCVCLLNNKDIFVVVVVAVVAVVVAVVVVVVVVVVAVVNIQLIYGSTLLRRN